MSEFASWYKNTKLKRDANQHSAINISDNASSNSEERSAVHSAFSKFSFDSVKATLQSSLSSASQSDEHEWSLGLTFMQRLQLCIVLLIGVTALFALSFFVYLPAVVLFPAKFGASFSFGSLLLIATLCVWFGPQRIFRASFQNPHQSTYSTLYCLSLLFSLYCVVFNNSYIMVLVSVGAQFTALALCIYSHLATAKTNFLGLFSLNRLSYLKYFATSEILPTSLRSR